MAIPAGSVDTRRLHSARIARPAPPVLPPGRHRSRDRHDAFAFVVLFQMIWAVVGFPFRIVWWMLAQAVKTALGLVVLGLVLFGGLLLMIGINQWNQ